MIDDKESQRDGGWEIHLENPGLLLEAQGSFQEDTGRERDPRQPHVALRAQPEVIGQASMVQETAQQFGQNLKLAFSSTSSQGKASASVTISRATGASRVDATSVPLSTYALSAATPPTTCLSGNS